MVDKFVPSFQTLANGVGQFYRSVDPYRRSAADLGTTLFDAFGVPVTNAVFPKVQTGIPQVNKRKIQEIVSKVESAEKKSRVDSINMGCGVEEAWIGPKGENARENRIREERAQLRLLQQSVAFGSSGPVTGLGFYSVPERIQEYKFCSSSSFSCGWGAESGRQGECGYSIQAPIWNHVLHALRRNIAQSEVYDTKSGALSNVFKLKVLEAEGEWHVRNNGVDPAELTVWQLRPRDGMIMSKLVDDGKAWFPLSDGGATTGFAAQGLFFYEQSGNTADATLPFKVPIFDQQTSVDPAALTVNFNLPVCMGRSFGDTVTTNSGFVANVAQAINEKDYWNSPQDYAAIVENFEVVPVYKRWMKAGDYSILKAHIPNSVTLGYQQDHQQDPLFSSDGIFTSEADERWMAWKKTWGPLYLFRVRGAPVYDAKFPAETKAYMPQQKINFGSAVLNVVFKSAIRACSEPYPEEYYQYKQYGSVPITSMDQMNFADEVQSAFVQPAKVQGSDV